jgi:hypothetical protein
MPVVPAGLSIGVKNEGFSIGKKALFEVQNSKKTWRIIRHL